MNPMKLNRGFAVRSAVLLAGMAAVVLSARIPRPEVVSDDAVHLPPFVVKARPLTSFGLALLIVVNARSKQVDRMFIKEVRADSEADANGLMAGTEIFSVDGRSVRSFVVRFDPESDLYRLFVNRRRGDRIRLVVIAPSATQSRTVVLTQGLPAGNFFPWHFEEFP
jgi:S1-C subfamily serine protease